MQSVQENVMVNLLIEHKKRIFLPQGIGGFEHINAFRLVVNNGEMPLIWFESIEYPNISFIVIDPFLFCPDYSPDFNDEDLEAIELENHDQILLLCIASPHQPMQNGITANLSAPILINWDKGIGKQVLIKNWKAYSFNYSILSPRNEFTDEIGKLI